jgi:hypothetical protein
VSLKTAGKLLRKVSILSLILLNAQLALSSTTASENGVSVSAKQDGSDQVKFEATNSTNASVYFSFKVLYTYKTLTGGRNTDSTTRDGLLGPNESSGQIATITEPEIEVESVSILYVTNP